MKILLINPPFPLESRYGKGLAKIGAILPSLGLGYVAAVLEQLLLFFFEPQL